MNTPAYMAGKPRQRNALRESRGISTSPIQTASAERSTDTESHEPLERNSLQRYLTEIGKIPLLVPTQEAELAALIQKGDRHARNLMIKANLRLVVRIAYDYKDFGLPLMDLISEGNIGLVKAVERFDPNKGGKLSTYASWWIKQSIRRALANQSKTIRLPVHLVDKVSRIRKTSRLLAEELGREPTNEEIGEELGIPPNKVAHFKSVSARPASLNAPLNDATPGNEFGDIVGDENALSPFENLHAKSMRGDLSDMFAALEDRESEIIKLRFGIEQDDPLTLEEVGRIFGITRERVRQLQNMALLKMRRIMSRNERQYTREEVDQASRERERNRVLREFYQQTVLGQSART